MEKNTVSIKYSLIVSYDLDNNIGYQNELLYDIPEDRKYFSKITTQNSILKTLNFVVMGRNTWESIPSKFKPLPNRVNIIVTSKPSKKLLELQSQHWNIFIINTIANIENWLHQFARNEMFRDHYNVFFIGGSRIYHDCLEYVDKLYITHIYHSLQLNGVKFPKIDFSKFQEISHSPIKTIERKF